MNFNRNLRVTFDTMFAFFMKHRYLLAISFFVVWLLFIDSNNFFRQMSSYSEINELKKQRDFYQKEIKETRQNKEDLFGNVRNLEKFAREKYMMKRDNEDLFLVVPENPIETVETR